MQFTLDRNDLIALSQSTRAELAALFFKKSSEADPANAEGYEFEDVVDFTPEMMKKFAERCSEKTLAGLRIFAEHGPEIHATLLNKAGIDNYGQFQSAVTRRTRTVTGDSDAYLFDWDDWTDGPGHYVVTSKTYESLRRFFEID
jgi:hypothetical protein